MGNASSSYNRSYTLGVVSVDPDWKGNVSNGEDLSSLMVEMNGSSDNVLESSSMSFLIVFAYGCGRDDG